MFALHSNMYIVQCTPTRSHYRCVYVCRKSCVIIKWKQYEWVICRVCVRGMKGGSTEGDRGRLSLASASVILRKVNVNWISAAMYACALCLWTFCASNSFLIELHKTLFVTIDTHLQLHLHALHHSRKTNTMHDIACEISTFPGKKIHSMQLISSVYMMYDVCLSFVNV